jgi:hypothetical protein
VAGPPGGAPFIRGWAAGLTKRPWFVPWVALQTAPWPRWPPVDTNLKNWLPLPLPAVEVLLLSVGQVKEGEGGGGRREGGPGWADRSSALCGVWVFSLRIEV